MANDQNDDTKLIAIKILNGLVGIISADLVEQYIVSQIKCTSDIKDVRIRKALVQTLVETSLVVSKNTFRNKLLPIFQK